MLKLMSKKIFTILNSKNLVYLRLRSATGIQMAIFIKLVQYAKNLGGKSRKNLVEHQIIKIDKKIYWHHLLFFRTPYSR